MADTPPIQPALNAEQISLRLARQIRDRIEAESDRGFEVLMSTFESPPTHITIAEPYGFPPPPSSKRDE